MGDVKVITSDFVHVQISTSVNHATFGEKRFPKDITISELKAKLELMTGGNCHTMKIQVFNDDNKLVTTLDDNNRLLGSYPVDDGMRLHVIDKFEYNLLEESVEKFELNEEEYAKRNDSVKSYLMKNKIGKYNEEYMKTKEQQEAESKALAESMSVGARCKVTCTNAPTRLGTVMYSGTIDGLSGYWVGVKYDEPVGKHDGCVKGKRYFTCPDKYGAFVKPSCIQVGDFPEEDYDLNEEI
ncbi:tubulin-folding cofactor B [Anthonomus grandis grandis]|uniref:tubulin-folding cofactor B n=1 Tax=Anthonomus grandis grandis TaxID=2921223 RepID=UPI002164F2F5|nr:tubulin-folding cofactor B [Anthonomus grandis grandis]